MLAQLVLRMMNHLEVLAFFVVVLVLIVLNWSNEKRR